MDKVAEKSDANAPSTVQVNATGVEILTRVKRQLGVGKAELVTRLLMWFDKQPKDVKIALLDSEGDPAAEILRLKLAEMQAAGVANPVAGTTLDGALALARIAIDRVEQLGREYELVARRETERLHRDELERTKGKKK